MTTTTETLTYEKMTWADGYWRTEYRNADNKLHRTDGPAYENSSGTKTYHVKGKYHRIDGPAIEMDGKKSWYLDGESFTEASHAKRVAAMNSETDEMMIIDDNGDNLSCTLHFGGSDSQTVTIDGKRYQVFLEEVKD